MPVSLQFEIEGEVQFSRRLLIADQGLSDFSKPMNRIGKELKSSFDRNFAARGGPFGGWPPRTKSYPWPLLEKTGTMRRSFKSRTGKDFVVLFNSAPYFKYHQSNKPRTRLPRRVMMRIDHERREYIQKALQAYIIKVTRGNGL